MRNNLTACDGPQLANAAPSDRGHSRRRRTMLRGLLALPLALALIAPGATALAAEATTTYGGNTPPPQTTTVPATKTEPTSTTSPSSTSPTTSTSSPKGGVSPSSTSSTPTSSTPAKSGTEPTATTAKAQTLPFTGLDLRWVILGGVLLVGMGMSILVAQRARSTNR